MKNRKKESYCGIVMLMLSLVLTGTSQAQSTSQSSPTALTAGEFKGKGPAKETIYYFSLTGGPGELTIALEIKAKRYSTFARLEVLDGELNTLATHNMNAATTSGSSQVLKKVDLGEKQAVLLKLALDGNLGDYRIIVGGAVEAAGSSPETSNPNLSPPTSSSNETSTTTDTTTPTQTTETPADTTAKGNNKFFNIDLGKFKLGQFLNMPKNGMLVIQLKDGTTQEIDLATVKSVTLKKP